MKLIVKGEKEKHEVDFFITIENRPAKLIEVKVSDDNFSSSLFRFHSFLKDATPVQIVYKLKRKKTKGLASMQPVHEFLKNCDLMGKC